jgi:hypothetical protein
MWYTNKNVNENLDYTYEHFHTNKDDWPALMEDVLDWLNCNIYPDELVTVSIFEDEHYEKKGRNGRKVHGAGHGHNGLNAVVTYSEKHHPAKEGGCNSSDFDVMIINQWTGYD